MSTNANNDRDDGYYWIHDFDLYHMIASVHSHLAQVDDDHTTSEKSSSRATAAAPLERRRRRLDVFLREARELGHRHRGTRRATDGSRDSVLARRLSRTPQKCRTTLNLAQGVLKAKKDMDRAVKLAYEQESIYERQIGKELNEYETLLLNLQRLRAIVNTDKVLRGGSDESGGLSCK